VLRQLHGNSEVVGEPSRLDESLHTDATIVDVLIHTTMNFDAIGNQPRFSMKEDLAAFCMNVSNLRTFNRENGIHFLRKSADRAAFVQTVGIELTVRLPDLPVAAKVGGEPELLVVHEDHVERLATDLLGL